LFTCVFIFVFFSTTAMATPPAPTWLDHDGFNWCPDPINDRSGGPDFETYGIGAKIVGTTLIVIVETNFPWTGVGPGVGTDSYGESIFSPGDLYINVGGKFQDGAGLFGENTGGTVYGIATTNHGDVQDEDSPESPKKDTSGALPDPLAWTPVTVGSLYKVGDSSQRMFATGTYEGYSGTVPGDGGTDPYGRGNNYPTLIRNGMLVTNTSTVAFATHATAPKYQYQYTVDVSYIGLTHGEYQLFWAMECGNDGAEWNGEVPEPSTVALVGAGVAAMAHRRRNRHA
ncbi:MAG: PEP-CTERM sorting domain-containing protein, partial [Candidatus Omnitrophica bacterium]|nr:PEP-CTERM sorting domain-containing protein [Candidatus Omnitrophota bacterium]